MTVFHLSQWGHAQQWQSQSSSGLHQPSYLPLFVLSQRKVGVLQRCYFCTRSDIYFTRSRLLRAQVFMLTLWQAAAPRLLLLARSSANLHSQSLLIFLFSKATFLFSVSSDGAHRHSQRQKYS